MSKKRNRKDEHEGLLPQGEGLQDFLQLAYRILGNPLAMFDLAYNLLAHTENVVADDPLWNELISQGTFNQKTVDFFFAEKFVELSANSEVVSVMKSSELKYDRMNGKLYDETGMQIGNVILVACYKPLTQKDIALFENICELIAPQLNEQLSHSTAPRPFQETVITDLIDGKDVKKALLEREFEALYSELKSNLYLAVVDVTQYDSTLTHLFYLKCLFERLQSDCKYYVYSNYIVILISTDDPFLKVKQDLLQLYHFFDEHHIFAGISSIFQNLFEVQKYYKQALHALNHGMKSNTYSHIFRYDNFRLDYFLSTIQEPVFLEDLQMLCHPVVPLIREYDTEHGTRLFDVLHSYFTVGGNVQLASSMIRMEREEYHALLEELGEKFEIEWDNGNMRLSIFLSIKIMDYYL